MSESKSNRKWPLAILAAVVFPVLALHSTCVAVLGPGTWGSGLVETLPEFKAPSAEVQAYRREFQVQAQVPDTSGDIPSPSAPSGISGEVTWMHRMNGQALYLTAGPEQSRQRLYVSDANHSVREVSIPNGHLVARPHLTTDGIIYVRWNPWAVPPASKLRRYVASWFDASLRPEASLYGTTSGSDGWHALMPGHSLTLSPDGSRAAILRSGALLAGYYSIHVWDIGSSEAPSILSLREHDDNASRSFRMRWSSDSLALHIQGTTGGFDRRSSHGVSESDGIPIDLLYMVNDMNVYDLNLGS